jgi:hypothetical protein
MKALTKLHYRPDIIDLALSTEVSGVLPGEVRPLFRQIVQRKNR